MIKLSTARCDRIVLRATSDGTHTDVICSYVNENGERVSVLSRLNYALQSSISTQTEAFIQRLKHRQRPSVA